jgi:hypothetical protein
MHLPQITLHFSDQQQKDIDTLLSLESIGEVFRAVHALAWVWWQEDPQYTEARATLTDGLSMEHMRDAVLLHEYHQSEHTEDIQWRLIRVAMTCESISRHIIRQIFASPRMHLLKEWERELMLASLSVCNGYDQLYLSVRKELLGEGGIEEALRTGKREGVVLSDELSAFAYGDMIFRLDEAGRVTAVPWSVAYRQETRMIAEGLDACIGIAQHFGQKEYEGYLRALRHATTDISDDPKVRDQLWRAVDLLWMDTTGPVQMIHMMESYWDEYLGRRLEPEFTFGILDSRYTPVNERIARLKPREYEGLRQWYGDDVDRLGAFVHSQAGVYAKTLSGSRLYFRNAGQNVPNRQDVRMHKGVKIFLDMDTFAERAEKQLRLVKKLFGGSAEQLFSESEQEDYVQMLAGVFVPGHEFGHVVFLDEHTEERLTPRLKDQLEEHKSDLTISALIPSLYPDLKDQEIFLKAYFLDLLRTLTHHDSHRNGAIQSVWLLIECGILAIPENPDDSCIWHATAETVAEFFRREKEVLDVMHRIYREQDTDRGRQLGAEQLAAYERIQESSAFKRLLMRISS